MAYRITFNQESLKRQFAVYVVVGKGKADTKVYVGKVGDNRDGCNPIISRCGNHFSYNKLHSQMRNKLSDHEQREYTCIFDHFDDYHSDASARRAAREKIDEMERWLREEINTALTAAPKCELLNPPSTGKYISKANRQKRASFRTSAAQKKIMGVVADVKREIGLTA